MENTSDLSTRPIPWKAEQLGPQPTNVYKDARINLCNTDRYVTDNTQFHMNTIQSTTDESFKITER